MNGMPESRIDAWGTPGARCAQATEFAAVSLWQGCALIFQNIGIMSASKVLIQSHLGVPATRSHWYAKHMDSGLLQ